MYDLNVGVVDGGGWMGMVEYEMSTLENSYRRHHSLLRYPPVTIVHRHHNHFYFYCYYCYRCCSCHLLLRHRHRHLEIFLRRYSMNHLLPDLYFDVHHYYWEDDCDW